MSARMDHLAAEGHVLPDAAPRLVIDNGWLVEQVDRHTCGTTIGGHYGAHEPGCGQIPVQRLDDLPGWPTPRVLPGRETLARTLALTEDYDGCFERLDAQAALPEGERDQEEIESDSEDAEWWRKRADAVVALLTDQPTVAEVRREAWAEGAEATAEWMANNPSPSGVPHDPPTNPYDRITNGDKG